MNQQFPIKIEIKSIYFLKALILLIQIYRNLKVRIPVYELLDLSPSEIEKHTITLTNDYSWSDPFMNFPNFTCHIPLRSPGEYPVALSLG
jgi:hypothetical protein